MTHSNRLFSRKSIHIATLALIALIVCSFLTSIVANALIPVGGGYSYEGDFGSKGVRPYWAKLAVDSDNNTYAVDGNSESVFKVSAQGAIVRDIRLPEFNGYPTNVAIDDSGDLYVSYLNADHPIVKFDTDGNFLQTIGERGSANNMISSASGVSVDSQGNVYVIDSASASSVSINKIKKFSPQGDYITSYGVYGLGDANLRYPVSIDTDSSDNVYIADSYSSKVSVFDALGQFQYKIDGTGAQNLLNGLTGLSIAEDTLYTSHTHGFPVRKFTTAGVFIEENANINAIALDIDVSANGTIRIVNDSKSITTYSQTGNVLSDWELDPNAYDALYDPRLIYTDPEGYSYIYNNNLQTSSIGDEYRTYATISKFNSNREFVNNTRLLVNYSNSETGVQIGSGTATDMKVGVDGSIYVLGNTNSVGTEFEDGSYAITKYSQDGGMPVDLITNLYTEDGTYLSPQGFALDEENNTIYYSGSLSDGEVSYAFASYNIETGAVKYLQEINVSSGAEELSLSCYYGVLLLNNKLYCPGYYSIYNSEEGTYQDYRLVRYDLTTDTVEPGVMSYLEGDGHSYSRQVTTVRSDKYGNLYLGGWFGDYDNNLGENKDSLLVKYKWGDENLSPIIGYGPETNGGLEGSINPSGFGTDDYGNIYVLDIMNSVGKKYSPAMEVPDKPVDVTFDSQTNTLYWKAPLYDGRSPITGYVIEYRQSGSNEWNTIEVNSSSRDRAMSMLSSGMKYDFKVYAVNLVGRSLPTEITVFTSHEDELIETPNTGYYRN